MTNLGSIGLGAVTLAAALGFYMSSYMVSAEREGIEDLTLQIAADNAAIDRLNAELGVRASLSRLEDINDKVWALQPPRPAQIVQGGTQLAALLPPLKAEEQPQLLYASAEAGDMPQVAEPSGRVQLAALGVESVDRAERERPRVQQANYVTSERAAPRFLKASASVEAAPRPAPSAQIAQAEPRAKPTAPKPAIAAPAKTAPAPAEDLFSDDFLAEVETAATLERAGFQKVALR